MYSGTTPRDNPIANVNKERLLRVIDKLASDSDREKLTAADVLVRQAKEHQLHLGEFLQKVFQTKSYEPAPPHPGLRPGGPSDRARPSGPRPNPSTQRSAQDQAQRESDGDLTDPEEIEARLDRLERLMEPLGALERLTAWEQQFARSLVDREPRPKRLTTKQLQVLERIMARLLIFT